MKHWLFNVMAGVSLVLCLATVAIWIDSHYREDSVFFQRWDFNDNLVQSQDDEVTFRAEAGQIEISEIFVQGDTGRWNPYYLKRYGQQSHHVEFQRTLSRSQLATILRDRNKMNWFNRIGFDFMGRILRGDLRAANLKGYGVFRGWMVIFPVWLVAALFSVLPVIAVKKVGRYLRARRYNGAGLCVCGYDLRATPERCPECGTVPLRQEAKLAKGAEERKAGEGF